MLASRRVQGEHRPVRLMTPEERWTLRADDGELRIVTVRYRIERSVGEDGTERFRREIHWIRDARGHGFDAAGGVLTERASGRRFVRA